MLDAKLAQKIADRVMKGLGHNINVMNENAIIIGSGSKERIGTFHEGAMRVIKTRENYEVSREEAEKLQGVRPGINMPIVEKSGAVVGVIGITGEPEAVGNIGELVKMAAELIIEQEESIDRLYRHRNDKEMFVAALLNDQAEDEAEALIEWGERMGYAMTVPRVACVFSRRKAPAFSDIEAVLEGFKATAVHSKQDISVVMNGPFILVFKALEQETPWALEQTVRHYIEVVLENVKDGGDIFCHVGSFEPGVRGYRSSYRNALRLSSRNGLDSAERICFAHRHLLPLLYHATEPAFFKQVALPYIQRISAAFSKGTDEVIATMETLIHNNFHYEKTAKTLFIHKNTVMMRKKKLEETLDMHLPASLDDIILLQWIIWCYNEMP